jgi:hypothetical protein
VVGIEISAAIIENSMKFLQKKKIELSHDLAIPLLGIYLKDMNSVCPGDICTITIAKK